MDGVGMIIGWSWAIIGMLMYRLGMPLLRGQVGRNHYYGVRFPQVFESDDAWYAINRFGGRCMIIWAVPLVVVGLLYFFFLPMQLHNGIALTLGFAPLVFVLAPVWQTWQFARQYHPNG